MRYRLIGVGILGSAAVSAQGALAQTASPAAGAENDGYRLEEVVVTAQKREERLQDVPISITAVTAQAVEDKAVFSIIDLQRLTPGLSITRQNNLPLTFIRGVGTTNGGPWESATATYVDGFYYYAPAATIFSLSNIERIEVLKGPQGTMFGRNATAGVMNIVTRRPQAHPMMDVSLSYGRFDAVEGKVYAAGGVAKGLNADIALYWGNQTGGWGRNLYDNSKVYRSTDFAARTKWSWTPTDTTDVMLSVDYSRANSDIGAAARILPPTIALDRLPPPSGFYDVRMDRHPYGATEQSGAGLSIRQQFGDYQVVSLTGYRQDNSNGGVDQDNSTVPFVWGLNKQHFKTFTQEFQLLSPQDGPVSWIAGAYYLNNTTKAYLPIQGTAIGALLYRATVGTQDSASYSAFVQATAELTPSTKLTAGGRYTLDEREVFGRVESNVSVQVFPKIKKRWSEPTWRLSLDHKPSEDVLLYASYNRGFRSGTFSPVNLAQPAVAPEILDAFEVGAKSDLLDHRLRLNASAFYYKFKDIQLATLLTGSPLLYNAARAEIRGAEVSVEAAPTEHLSVQLGAALLDGDYSRFPNGQFFAPRPTGGAVQFVGDASGNSTIMTPKVTFSAAAQYVMPTSFGDIRLAADYYYNDGYFADAQNSLRQDSYSVANASIGWVSSGERYEARLWTRNLAGEKYFLRLGASAQGFVVAPAEPRTYGITLIARLR